MLLLQQSMSEGEELGVTVTSKLSVDDGKLDHEEDEKAPTEPLPHQDDNATVVSDEIAAKTTCVQEGVSLSSMFHDITVFRDFFLAAFSDGNHSTTTWCGDEACCTTPRSYGGVKTVTSEDSTTLRKSRSTSSYDAAIQKSPSHDSRRRRKKPLAVAVGFHYAEDPNGRPIVITPTGTRNSPIDLTNVGNNGVRPMPSLRNMPQPSSGRTPPAIALSSRMDADTRAALRDNFSR